MDFLLPADKQAIGELISMPIISSSRELLGAILVGYETDLEPDETQINQLSLVCTALASTLERIYGQQKLQSELVEKQTLLRLSALLEGNSDEHIGLALEEIRLLAGADVAAIHLLDGQAFRPRLWLGEAPVPLQEWLEAGIPIEQARRVWASLGVQYQVLDDQDHEVAGLMRQTRVQAVLVFNLRAGDQLEGVILYRLRQRRG